MRTKLQGWQGRRTRWWDWPSVIFLLLVAGFLLKSVGGLWYKGRLTAKEEQSAKSEVQELLARKLELEREIEVLGTKRGVEAALREKFAVAKPGEKVVNIVDDASLEIVKNEPNFKWWQVIWQALVFWK